MNHTCSVSGCGRVVVTRGFCEGHYSRVKRHRRPYLECRGCGGPIYELGWLKYCSDDCRPKCSVESCGRVVEAKGYCTSHYLMFRKKGTPFGAYKCVPKKNGYECVICGDKFTANGVSRKCCSPSCRAMYERYGSAPSLDFTCTVCGIFVKRKWVKGAHQKPDRSVCSDCKSHPNNRGWYRRFYDSDEGRSEVCKLCGEPVDMSIEWPDPRSRSIDHIIPVSLGGGHELDNLQLAHLYCNQSKQALPVR